MSEAFPAGIVRRVKSGVAIVSTLLAAAAVMRLLSSALHVPMRDWLAGLLAAYAHLTHPIVDWTIGLVPALFGYALRPAAKDGLILYGLGAGACYRALQAQVAALPERRRPEPQTRKHKLLFAAFAAAWPLMLKVMLTDTRNYYRHKREGAPRGILVWRKETPAGPPEEIDLEKEGGPDALRYFLRELFFVFLIVAVCMALNAAGVITLPD